MFTPYRAIARNYATEHANRIHSEETAVRYGFAGGLVPGVALYAYLTDPLAATLGREWLRRGTASARFLKPVYDGDEVEIQGRVTRSTPPCIALDLYDSSGTLCAVGEATLPEQPASIETINAAAYPRLERPANAGRRPATLSAIAVGDIFWSWEFTVDLAGAQRVFMAEIGSAPEIYRGPDAVLHPAWLLAQANEIVAHNVALGPWIHTGSEVWHSEIPEDGERLSLRGRVAEANEKRGHDYIQLDLALFGRNDRLIALIRHSALIRLREREASNKA